MGNLPLTEEERRQFAARLADLRIEHRDLDDAIRALETAFAAAPGAGSGERDELQVRRMKKRKLLLKDEIAWLERHIEPDERA